MVFARLVEKLLCKQVRDAAREQLAPRKSGSVRPMTQQALSSALDAEELRLLLARSEGEQLFQQPGAGAWLHAC